MGVEKATISFNFGGGSDTKTDPLQVKLGKFLSLKNGVFDTLLRLTKRNGFPYLPVQTGTAPISLSTFKNSLVAIDNSLSSYSSNNQSWQNKGGFFPLSLSTTPLIRNSLNQSQCDSAVASNGVVCVAYSETQNSINFTYKYSLLDSTTGETLTSPTTIVSNGGSASGAPRVFNLGIYFVIVFTATNGAVNSLQYIAINANTYSVTTPLATVITTNYSPSSMVAFDGVVAASNGSPSTTNLYLAWNGASASGIFVTFIDTSLTQHSVVNADASHTAQVMGVCADISQTPTTIWMLYQGSSGSAYARAVDSSLNLIGAATAFDSSRTVLNVTGYASAAVVNIVYEHSASYNVFGGFSVSHSNLRETAVTQGGVTEPDFLLATQIGLASKAFVMNSKLCVLTAFSTPFQPSYFLLDVTSVTTTIAGNSTPVLAKLAYQNGGGYLTTGLPGVSSIGSAFMIPYLFKDLVQSVNKGTNQTNSAQSPLQAGGIYSQTGVNLVSFSVATTTSQVEIGSNLNISGGFLSAYDGTALFENNYFIYPELRTSSDGAYHITNAYNVPVSPTCTVTSGSTLISVSSTFGLAVGQIVTGTGIQAGSVVVAIGTNAVTISLPGTSTGSGRTITFTGNVDARQYYYQFTYEWTDNQGNAFRSAPSIPVGILVASGSSSVDIIVPTLPITNKSTSIKLVGYRWSAAQQEYFQFTSIPFPTLNDFTVAAITITDSNNDATILGNNLLYTTGGVVENTSPPSSNVLTLFDQRIWLLDAEDPNLFWYSKPVSEAVPVEMSDLLTYFVSPIVGGQGSTGPVTADFPLDDKLILFSQNCIRYINGTGPDATGNNGQYSQPIYITSPVGCTNQNSITVIPEGLVFQASNSKGIWLLGHDLVVKYIGADEEAFNQYTVTSATTVPGTNQARFTLNNGVTLMYDYYVGQWGEFYGVPAVSSCIYNGLHTILNSSGVISQESSGTYLDGPNPVLMSFITPWIQSRGLQGYQNIYWGFLLGQYFSPHTLNVDISYDYNPNPSQRAVIRPDNNTLAFGNDGAFGVGTPMGDSTIIEQWQINFERQPCQAFQLSVSENFDPSIGLPAGVGLTISGFDLVVGAKTTYPRNLPATRKTG